jgi:two-component system sensor histidine kinase MprB
MPRLRARLRALLRRSGATAEVLRFADVELDLNACRAERGGRHLELTKTELSLLELFLRNPRRVLSRTQIFESVWGYDFVYTAPFPDGKGALVRTAIPVSDPAPTLRELAGLLVGSTVVAGLLAALASRLAAGRVLRPVRVLTETVERIRRTGDLTVRIPADSPDEIGRLGSEFAAMTAALDDSVGAQRRLVADASHELRTPLTSLTVNLELLAENPADSQAPQLAAEALGQAAELTALVNDLVDLARYGQPAFHTEDVRLDLVAERVTARATRRAPHLNFDLSGTPTLVHGDPDALERAVANLVDNAVKWSPPGGRIGITVDAGVVEVADTGPGIPDGDRAFVFDRFYRSPAARSYPGSGLGLAIVRQVAGAHGGTAEALPREGGALLRLTLPVCRGDIVLG